MASTDKQINETGRFKVTVHLRWLFLLPEGNVERKHVTFSTNGGVGTTGYSYSKTIKQT